MSWIIRNRERDSDSGTLAAGDRRKSNIWISQGRANHAAQVIPSKNRWWDLYTPDGKILYPRRERQP